MLGLRKIAESLRSGPVAVEAPAAPAPAAPVPRPASREAVTTALGREYRLFFLCGHPKSGTNWIGAVLNLHPKINIRGEFRFETLRNAFDTLERHWWHVAHTDPARAVAEECFRESVRRIMGAVADRKPDAEWIGDRTPRVLRPLLAGAPHLYALRDPRDVLVSWAFQQIRELGGEFAVERFRPQIAPLHEAFKADPHHFAKHPERLLSAEPWVRALARRMRTHIGHDLEALRRIESGELDAPVHVVRYERLHADLEGERGAMYRFLGLDPAEAEAPSRATKTLPGFESEDPTSFFRKGATEDWKLYFTDEARRWFKQEAGGLLVELGYENNENW